MKKIDWKPWIPLAVGLGVLVLIMMTLTPWRRPQPNTSHSPPHRDKRVRLIDGARVRESEPQAVVVPDVPPEERVARATRQTSVRRTIQQAIGAEVKRDKRTRAAKVASLKKDREYSLNLIHEEMNRAKLPEHIRQLDMLAKEVNRP